LQYQGYQGTEASSSPGLQGLNFVGGGSNVMYGQGQHHGNMYIGPQPQGNDGMWQEFPYPGKMP
jgi:hypothetical protein